MFKAYTNKVTFRASIFRYLILIFTKTGCAVASFDESSYQIGAMPEDIKHNVMEKTLETSTLEFLNLGRTCRNFHLLSKHQDFWDKIIVDLKKSTGTDKKLSELLGSFPYDLINQNLSKSVLDDTYRKKSKTHHHKFPYPLRKSKSANSARDTSKQIYKTSIPWASISLDESDVTVEGLELLVMANKIRTLSLRGVRLAENNNDSKSHGILKFDLCKLSRKKTSPSALGVLKGLTSLTSLDLSYTNIAVEDLIFLQGLKLEYLDLRGNLLDGEKLSGKVENLLKHMPLKTLLIGKNMLGEEGLRVITQIKTISVLEICSAEIPSGDGLYFPSLVSLKTLRISHNKLTTADLVQIAKLPLEELWIDDNNLDGNAEKIFLTMPNLKRITFYMNQGLSSNKVLAEALEAKSIEVMDMPTVAQQNAIIYPDH